ncbi:reactive intermediate/imine deaminase [Parasphingorhabdus marina DSM 22363]|uniref:Reactive intermediate/imine deaminase n=1 Tax=Parasphingorhabdus marina DSM 22363 TaxID=1123272 RepID=A0A1N6HJN3_9SPHN|nr:RidA family protein [Parasphingorhabdus marina]SIO20048.1 reactive intermediate/imine deaminase [Parasphingorhabdus marina DSM 22363]
MRTLVLAAMLAGLPAQAALADDRDASEKAESEIVFHTTEAAKKAGFPFSKAVEADGWIFLSGELGIKEGSGLVPGGIAPETRQTMLNIRQTLADQGLGMDRIVKCTAFLADMAEWPAFNTVYKEFFKDNYPARSALGASGLALNARVEIECIARR